MVSYSAFRAWAGVAVCLLATPFGTVLAEPPPDESPATSFSHRMAQGAFFLEGGLPRQALAEFEAAALLPEGQAEPTVHQLLAKTRYQLGELAGAVDSARTAAALSARVDPEFAGFHDFLTTRFGKVLIIGGSTEGAVRPEPATPLLDPELKRAFERSRSELDQVSDGSTSVYLPVGSYRVAGHIIEVSANGVTRMDLRPSIDASGSGVYGERRGDDRRRKGPGNVQKRARPNRRSLPPPDGAFLLQGGGAGYVQQGNGSASARVVTGVELGVVPMKVFISAALIAGVGRAERFRGGAVAPPAGSVGGRFAGAVTLPVGSRLQLGPMFAWSIAGHAPFVALLPPGYLGPAAYLVQGPELGVRFAGRSTPTHVRPVVEVYAFVTESSPQGSGEDQTKPHVSAGVGLDVGIRTP